jgi:prolyl-tRNA editing enzyme YbaK/EbsC (Cys-tRNA(Pro) deacylase)
MTDFALTPDDLYIFMQSHAIPGEILYLGAPTPTVEAAAQVVNTTPEHIVKSILFLVGDQPVLTITCGNQHVNYRALAGRYGVNRKKVKLAPADLVLTITGYAVGAMPPFGHRAPLETLLDYRVLGQSIVFAGGGAENALVRLDPQVILSVTQAQILDLLDPPMEH